MKETTTGNKIKQKLSLPLPQPNNIILEVLTHKTTVMAARRELPIKHEPVEEQTAPAAATTADPKAGVAALVVTGITR